MILSPEDLRIVRAILARRLPGVEVRAFGSRVTGRAWEGSDLDLVIVSEERIPFHVMGELKEDFAESDLPVRVDVSEFVDLPKWLRKVVDDTGEVIQQRSEQAQGYA